MPDAEPIWRIAWSDWITLPDGKRMVTTRSMVLIFTRMFFDARDIACIELDRERCDIEIIPYDPSQWPDAWAPAPSGSRAKANDVISRKKKRGRPIQVRQVQNRIRRPKPKARKNPARSNRIRHASPRKLQR